MAKKLYEEANIQNIAKAIRAKSGKSDKMSTALMAEEISQLPKTQDYEDYINILNGKIVDFVLPEGVKKVKDYLFYPLTTSADNRYLKTADLRNSNEIEIGRLAFGLCCNLKKVVFSENAEYAIIWRGAFADTLLLESIRIPARCIVHKDAFVGYGLETVTFFGANWADTVIDSAAFEECPHLTTINVPWAEGEVANAPWGATNAAINYNYTGE